MAVARRDEASLEQIAKDFGVSINSVANRLRKADIDEGANPGITTAEAAEIRDLRRRIRLLEQEAEVMRRALVDPPPATEPEPPRGPSTAAHDDRGSSGPNGGRASTDRCRRPRRSSIAGRSAARPRGCIRILVANGASATER